MAQLESLLCHNNPLTSEMDKRTDEIEVVKIGGSADFQRIFSGSSLHTLADMSHRGTVDRDGALPLNGWRV
jgi:hypothetical protein